MRKKLLQRYIKNLTIPLILNVTLMLPFSIYFCFNYFLKINPEIPSIKIVVGILFIIVILITLYNFFEFLINNYVDIYREEKEIKLREKYLLQYQYGAFLSCRNEHWNEPYKNQIVKVIGLRVVNEEEVYVNVHFVKKELNNLMGAPTAEFLINWFDVIPEPVYEKNYEDWDE